MKVLVINSGSSSIKYQLFNMEDETVLARGIAGRIGIDSSYLEYENYKGYELNVETEIPDHKTGIGLIINSLVDQENGVLNRMAEIDAVGHRVAHGGDIFSDSALVTEEVFRQIERFIELAPLHLPHNLAGIKICSELLPGVPQVAVFDTAFHHSIPLKAYLYGLPYEYYEKYGLRHFGFHGTSHKFVAGRAAVLMNRDIKELRIISCHLGSGASISAIDSGVSVENSMGFTPLEGLVMGTRCGDLDPGIVPFLAEKEDMTTEGINQVLNHESGILGLSGISSDYLEVVDAAGNDNQRAQIALEVFYYRVRKYIGSYTAVMGGIDAIVFTGGIGENNADARKDILNGLEFLRIRLNNEANQVKGGEKEITTEDSLVKVFAIPTNEELVIARDTKRLAGN